MTTTNPGLLDRLEALRERLVNETGMDDLYEIYSDKQLSKLSITGPVTELNFLHVLFNRHDLAMFDELFLEEIQDYLGYTQPHLEKYLRTLVVPREVKINELLEPVNKLRQKEELEAIDATEITKRLVKLGYLVKSGKKRVPTAQGKLLGISLTQANGHDFSIVAYDSIAQMQVLKILNKMHLIP